MSAWKQLSFFTAIVVFFSGITSNSAQAAKVAQPVRIITEDVMRSLNSPAFACQILWVRIQESDRQELELLLSSMSHVDQVARRESVDLEKDQRFTTFMIQSLLWVPGAEEFKTDVRAMRELKTLDIVGCQMFTQTPKARRKT